MIIFLHFRFFVHPHRRYITMPPREAIGRGPRGSGNTRCITFRGRGRCSSPYFLQDDKYESLEIYIHNPFAVKYYINIVVVYRIVHAKSYLDELMYTDIILWWCRGSQRAERPSVAGVRAAVQKRNEKNTFVVTTVTMGALFIASQAISREIQRIKKKSFWSFLTIFSRIGKFTIECLSMPS